jgi:dCTP deaminase
MNKGVFSKQGLEHLFEYGRLTRGEFFKNEHIGPASVDLTISSEVYELDYFLLPGKRQTVRSMLKKISHRPIAIGDPLLPGKTYMSLASVGVNFPAGVYAYANAKSTTGRNFILVRTLADHCVGFDTVDRRAEGYTGEIWLLIQPLVYGIVASPHECLSQLRVFNDDTRITTKDALQEFLLTHDLLYRTDGRAYNHGELTLDTHCGTFLMTLEAETEGVIGYQAKKSDKILDLSARDVDPNLFFEKVYARKDNGNSFARLEPGEYYLLTSHEQIKIPVTHSAEMRAIDPRLGLFFSHFAGFFDPGFFGTATLEVMSPSGDWLRHGHPVAAFELECMQEATVSYAQTGNYAGQIGTKLPKQFRNF